MEGPRAPFQSEFPEIIEFLDNSLRSDKDWSIASEYPTVLNSKNINNMRIIREGSEVLSHAVIKPLIIKTPVAIFKVAAIGSVVTNSSYRNQGLSRQIIEECLEEAHRQDCDFAILWTNLYDFYKKFDFELAGSECSIVIDHPMQLDQMPLVFREGSNIDPAAVHRVYSRHTVGSVRTVDEIRSYLRIPNSRVYSAWDATGALQAYAIEGKGADLDGYIHEWGGGVNELCQLINYMHKRQKRDLTLIAPSHSVSLIQRLRQENFLVHEGHLGMIKLINPNALFSKVQRHLRNDFGINGFVLECADGEYRVGTSSGIFKTTHDDQIIRLLFGPQRPSELFPFDAKSIEILDRVLPLRLWFWGWDSV